MGQQTNHMDSHCKDILHRTQRTRAHAPVKLAVGAIILLVGRPPRVLLLKLAEQLVHQRVRDAVRVILVGYPVRA